MYILVNRNENEYNYSKEYINVLCVKEIIIRPLNLFHCSRYERKFEQENKLSVNDNRPCFQVSLCVILLLSRELRMRRKWFDFRYHSRWKNNLSQPLTYPMTVVKINRVIAIAYIYFSYASFDMSSLYASFVGCILNVQNAYDKRENVCAINLVPLKKLGSVM